MADENKSGLSLGNIGIILILFGIYLFLAHQIRVRATKMLTMVVGSLIAFSVTIWGSIAIVNWIKGGKAWGIMPGVYGLLAISCILYVLVLIKAVHERKELYSFPDGIDISIPEEMIEKPKPVEAIKTDNDESKIGIKFDKRSTNTTWDY